MIYDDRDSCPRYLNLDFGSYAVPGPVHIWGSGSGTEEFHIQEECPENGMITLPVDRDITGIMAWTGIGEATLIDNGPPSCIIKKDGQPADSIFSYLMEIGPEEEEAYGMVRFRQEFARVNLSITGCGENGIYVEITGAGRGFRVNRDEIGNTAVIIPEGIVSGSGIDYNFNILRQKDLSPLSIGIYAGKAGASKTSEKGTLIREYPIGLELMKNGYDMTAEILPSVDLSIDVSEGLVSISTDGWESTERLEITI